MSTSPQQQGAPSPALVFETLNAYQRTAALRGAIDLDLFTAIAEGNSSVAAIASKLKASEKGTRVLCDYLTMMGFLTKQNGAYALSQDSAIFLNRHSPAYMGSVTRFLGLPEIANNWTDMAALVRKGGTLTEGGTVEPDNPIWVEFAHSMAPLMRPPSEIIARTIVPQSSDKCKVLDIAAGHGLFGIAIASHNPNAKIVAQDWAAVLAVAEENAKKAGVADRYSKLPGSAFDVDFGTGYNVVLLTNFLHHFSIAENEKLLRKVYAALAPGGVAVTLEFIPNEDRVSPPMDASFAMMMLGSTPHGDAYTFAEYDAMFQKAGFARSEMRELTPLPQRVVVSYK